MLWRPLHGPAARMLGALTRRDAHSRAYALAAAALLALDGCLTYAVVRKVEYTEIDWKAYMQEVGSYLDGERDYVKMKGDTGPLVYPAGFVYVYAALKQATGGVVANAQPIFAALYIAYVALAMLVTARAKTTPPYALAMICLSKRLHSIFVLRLFNDGVAMLPALAAVAVAQVRTESPVRDVVVGALFSLGVSVKMNVLLMAPAAAVLWLQHSGGVWNALRGAAAVLVVQLAVGFEFLSTYPASYLSKAFEFGRVFLHRWTVNFKFVPEELFVSKRFALGLLALHLAALAWFGHARWCTRPGGLVRLLRVQGFGRLFGGKGDAKLGPPADAHAAHAATALFTANFVGILFARSLHYQFFSWYACTLPHLLYTARFFPWESQHGVPALTDASLRALASHAARVALWASLEVLWVVYPSTRASSLTLLFVHLVLFAGLVSARAALSPAVRSRRPSAPAPPRPRRRRV